MKSKRAGNCFDTTVYPLDRDGATWEIEVRVHYAASYDPGRTYGPPELCYPPESEMDMTKIEILHDLPAILSEAEVLEAAEKDMDRLEEEAWEDYSGRRNDRE